LHSGIAGLCRIRKWGNRVRVRCKTGACNGLRSGWSRARVSGGAGQDHRQSLQPRDQGRPAARRSRNRIHRRTVQRRNHLHAGYCGPGLLMDPRRLREMLKGHPEERPVEAPASVIVIQPASLSARAASSSAWPRVCLSSARRLSALRQAAFPRSTPSGRPRPPRAVQANA